MTWAALGKMLYEGACDSFYTDNGNSPGNICRKEGATMALFIILYTPIIAMLQTALWNHGRNKVKEPEIAYKAPGENPEISSRFESSREVVSEAALESNK